MWVVNPDYRRDTSVLVVSARNGSRKVKAEKDMILYDKLPKVARLAVGEYGQLHSAKGRSGADKVASVKATYERKLRHSAVFLK